VGDLPHQRACRRARGDLFQDPSRRDRRRLRRRHPHGCARHVPAGKAVARGQGLQGWEVTGPHLAAQPKRVRPGPSAPAGSSGCHRPEPP